MPKKKVVSTEPADMAPIVRLFSGAQVDERFRTLLASHPAISVAKWFDYRITNEAWEKALEYTKAKVEEEYRCPSLVDIEKMRAESVRYLYIQGMKAPKALPANVEMDAFSILVQLAAKGVIPIDMLREVSSNLNTEDLEFRERMIGYTEAALVPKK